MKIDMMPITVRELYNGYQDNEELGVYAFSGKLCCRPPYQREFIYDTNEQEAVIQTVRKGFPLNIMYWCADNAGNYELLDGQQRTLSICRYVKGLFSVNIDGHPKTFKNLTGKEQNQILDYQLMVYVCTGDESEKLEWFRVINIAGLELTQQELRNAIYTGSWVTKAKKIFSKSNGAACQIGNRFLSGEVNRQAYLEKAIKWKLDYDNRTSGTEYKTIEDYMSVHQHDETAEPLWKYFEEVIEWVQTVFPKYHKDMSGLEWGLLYNEYMGEKYDPELMEQQYQELYADDDVTKKKGIYEYLLSGKTKEKCLSIRAFTDTQKRKAYKKQQGICPYCKKHFELEEMHGDHITAWSKGGRTIDENLQMLCRDCNLKKSSE